MSQRDERLESPDFRYDKWAGNKAGYAQDPERCVQQVTDHTGFHFLQCSRKRGHGPGNFYCKQHAKMLGAKQEP